MRSIKRKNRKVIRMSERLKSNGTGVVFEETGIKITHDYGLGVSRN